MTKPGEAAKPGEEARLLAHATSPLMRDLIIAGVDTGCRPGELLGLQWQHVNRLRCLPGSVTKTGKDRDVPYAPKGRLAGPTGDAASRPGGESLPPTAHVFGDACGERVRTYRDEWARTCAAAGIVGLQFRDLRRTFRSELLETPGVILHHVRDALGHADIKTTSIYLSTTLKGLEDVIRRREAAPVSHTIRTRTTLRPQAPEASQG